MTQYYYYSKVLAQLSAIFYRSGLPRDNDSISNYMYKIEDNSHNFYNEEYDIKLDALDAYNKYISGPKTISFKEIFKVQLKRNLSQ